jgi:hypothetical protein
MSAVAVARTEQSWAGHIGWMLAGAALGFGVSAIFAGWLRLPRNAVVLGYLLVVGPFLYGYVRWSGADVVREVRHHWAWGVLAGAIVGAFTVANVLSQLASAVPAGLDLVFALFWLGLVYGTLDALLLSVLPVYATWHALTSLGWTERWIGRLAAGLLALGASVLITAAYHMGFPEYQSGALAAPVFGNTVMSIGYLLSTNPLGAIISHIAMHVAGVLHGVETTVQLPPHY